MDGLYRELETLVRAHYPLIYLVSYEESRAERELLIPVAKRWRAGNCLAWTCTKGFVNLCKPGSKPDPSAADPLVALDRVSQHKGPALFVLKDFHAFMGDVQVVRRLRDLVFELPQTPKNIVILSPILRIPPELEKDITVLDHMPPNLEELGKILDRILAEVKDNPNVKVSLTPEARERLLRAALGLTSTEAENIFAKAIVRDGKLGEDDISLILEEKKQIIRKTGVLEYFEAEEGMEDVGGLDVVKDWLQKRLDAFSEEARRYGLPIPRGVLLLGVPGCGKSLVAKAASKLWRMPLLRLDIGRVFGSLVGESEQKMRQSIRTAEAVAPCVLWIDEIEKGFAGTRAGELDSGVTARVFGTFLTWMQEKKSPVFVIATANDISSLPPEMLRKGRFDEIFFVDLPTEPERREILAIHLRKRGRDPSKFDLDLLARESAGFTGAELEEAVVNALFDAFHDGRREVTTEDILRNIRQIVPLSTTMREEIESLREWARTRARPASSAAARPEPIPGLRGRRLAV